jgi:hypothetical protein
MMASPFLDPSLVFYQLHFDISKATADCSGSETRADASAKAHARKKKLLQLPFHHK